MLVLLGVVSSAFLVFSSSLQLVRLGLVIALWAAVIGALAATRFRRDAAGDQAKVRNLQTVYELQLEREITARREYELGVEARVRAEVGADAAELAALRTELSVLRESLQRLFDGDLPGERRALRADAVRLPELLRPANDSSTDADSWDAWSSPTGEDAPVPLNAMAPRYEADHPAAPAFAKPYDDPVTAETSVVPLEHLAAAFAASQESANPGWAFRSVFDPASDEVPPVAVDPAAPEPVPAAAAAAADSTDPAADPAATDAAATDAADAAAEVTDTAGDADRASARKGFAGVAGKAAAGARRRRRTTSSDPAVRKLSVAEIMANLQSERGGVQN
ncbi:hypothetical protein EBN03_26370 [Nocardia stercoris]|uniref:DUF6779 domain-containing protein n=1 Tax=Nocardia stercoris TaxID=2483361 RepID=A0A3M2KYD0_9NOCA|nr:hypothetical protein EBN03_26370 [Nocardia stercoris]